MRRRSVPRLQYMKKYFITGLLIWVPLAITVWVLYLIVSTMDQSLLFVPAAHPSGKPVRRQRSPASAWS